MSQSAVHLQQKKMDSERGRHTLSWEMMDIRMSHFGAKRCQYMDWQFKVADSSIVIAYQTMYKLKWCAYFHENNAPKIQTTEQKNHEHDT